MKGIHTLLLLLPFLSASAQTSSSSFVVKAGTSIAESIPAKELYHYAQFLQGTVFFKDGSSAAAKLNYNRLLDEMQFTNVNGDTLALANEALVKSIVVDNKDTFYWNDGFIRLVETHKNAKLAVKQKLKLTDVRKKVAYDMSSSVSSVKTVNAVHAGSHRYGLTVQEDLLLSKDEKYYFGDSYNHFLLANRKNLFDLFAKYQAQIKEYLKENKVEFTSKEDLQKLLQFVESLSTL